MGDQPLLRPPSALAPILERSGALGFTMASEPRTGALLRALAASKPAGRFLELGTGTGVATSSLLDGMDSASRLISVDVDEQVQAVARDAFPHDSRLSLVTGDALAFLGRQEPASFDLVFADAMPGKYEGLADALRVVRIGGFYVIDDMLPQPNWPADHPPKVSALLAQLAALDGFQLAPLRWASGVVIAVRMA